MTILTSDQVEAWHNDHVVRSCHLDSDHAQGVYATAAEAAYQSLLEALERMAALDTLYTAVVDLPVDQRADDAATAFETTCNLSLLDY